MGLAGERERGRGDSHIMIRGRGTCGHTSGGKGEGSDGLFTLGLGCVVL